MTERCFLIKAPLHSGKHLPLPQPIINHLRVLRLKEGDTIFLCDGDGKKARAQLRWIAGVPHAEIEEVIIHPPQPEVGVLIGWPKMPAAEAAARAATEVGASWIAFFQSKRSPIQAGPSPTKIRRLERIVEDATRQSERLWLPRLLFFTDLKAAITHLGHQHLIALDARCGEDLLPILQNISPPLTMVIGAEGGLAPEELSVIAQKGGKVARASLPVLRVETAAAVFSALPRLVSRA